MNKYIVPYCTKSELDVHVIYANSLNECKEKLMEEYSELSDANDFETFIDDLYKNGVDIGTIRDVEEL